jgi:hypothetical protein
MKKKHNMLQAQSLIEAGFANPETVERLLSEADGGPLNRYLIECEKARTKALLAESAADMERHHAEMSAWLNREGFADMLVRKLWEKHKPDKAALKEALRQSAGFINDYSLQTQVNEAYKRITQ